MKLMAGLVQNHLITEDLGNNPVTKDKLQELKEKFGVMMAEMGKKIEAGNNLNTPYLQPYRYLYATKETGKYFIFPIINDSSFSASNKWGDDSDNNGQGFLTKLITSNLGWLPTLAVAGKNTVNEISNLIDIFKSDKNKIER